MKKRKKLFIVSNRSDIKIGKCIDGYYIIIMNYEECFKLNDLQKYSCIKKKER